MKNIIKFLHGLTMPLRQGLPVLLLLVGACNLYAQDTPESPATAPEHKPVKSTFGSGAIMDNQTVMAPVKGTFEFAIQHRFGIVNQNEAKDLWGLYGPSNIRLSCNYAPINRLQIGFGLTKFKMAWDFNLKYGILQQEMNGGWPVSVTYYGNIAIDGRAKKYFGRTTDRYSYFNEIIIARKITSKLSLQVAPTLSYFNSVDGYIAEDGTIKGKMKNAHFAVSAAGRFKVGANSAVIVGLDQPITQHPLNNPYPNIAFGYEVTTSAHSFQFFAGEFQNIVPQYNNMFNQFDYKNGQFLIGFNITRLWNW